MDRMRFERDPLEAALEQELQRSERILWQERQLPRVSKASLGIFLFAIPWTAFAIFWIAMAFTGVSDAETGWLGYAFPLFGLPFVAVGLGMMATPFLPLLSAHKTIFAITNQRILRLYLGGRLRIESVPLERIGRLQRSESRDGSGSLRIALTSKANDASTAKTRLFTIGEVANIRQAEERVRELKTRGGPHAVQSTTQILSPSASSPI